MQSESEGEKIKEVVPTNATRWMLSATRALNEAARSAPNNDSWQTFLRAMVSFRESLACSVCKGLVSEPKYPYPGDGEHDCQHHVCGSCWGMKKNLRPPCSWCRDYNNYVPCRSLDSHVNVYEGIVVYCKSLRQYKQVKHYSTYSKRTLSTLPASLQPLSFETLVAEVLGPCPEEPIPEPELPIEPLEVQQQQQQQPEAEPVEEEKSAECRKPEDGDDAKRTTPNMMTRRSAHLKDPFSAPPSPSVPAAAAEKPEDVKNEVADLVKVEEKTHIMKEIHNTSTPRALLQKGVKRKSQPIARQNCKCRKVSTGGGLSTLCSNNKCSCYAVKASCESCSCQNCGNPYEGGRSIDAALCPNG
ncbi:unnamed protein product [Notodromas monacha]|uniref:CXC MSL2-type domain-containing protein n=1 Tax=Notodromas monacha TaxID=399045 RepID=A0A7R9GI07_9CRUS|nr:unnamed protein product [Notodromas monacha]CAG0921915.1 unnamed protein product [Notodromas monacha]